MTQDGKNFIGIKNVGSGQVGTAFVVYTPSVAMDEVNTTLVLDSNGLLHMPVVSAPDYILKYSIGTADYNKPGAPDDYYFSDPSSWPKDNVTVSLEQL
jgi:hypothetical protein